MGQAYLLFNFRGFRDSVCDLSGLVSFSVVVHLERGPADGMRSSWEISERHISWSIRTNAG